MASDGLSNPTSIAIRDSTVYVASGAYFNHVDPNLMVVHLGDDREDSHLSRNPSANMGSRRQTR